MWRGGRSFLVLLLVTALLRLSLFFVPFYSGDEATYSALASRILTGALPYAGAVDHKPPGIELTYALVYAIAGRNHLWAVRALLVVVVALTGSCLGRTAGLMYVCVSMLGLPGDMQAANTELFLNLPLVLAASLAARRGHLSLAGAGFLTGIAGLYKYQAALAGIAWAVTAGRRAGRLACLAAGFAGVALPYLAFFRWEGIWSSFVFWGWRYNFQYMATLSAWEVARNAVGYTLLMAAFWSPLRLSRSRDPLLLSWLAAMLAAVSVGGRFFPHYYLMALPPLCLLARCRVPLLAGLLALSIGLGWGWYHVKPGLRRYHAAYLAVGHYVRDHSAPDDRLFVWGNSPEIYYYSDRVMGTRFPFCNYHTGKIWGSRFDDADATGTEAHIVHEAWVELMTDLHEHPPLFIVDGGAGRLDRYDLHPIGRYPELARFVSERYVLDAVIADVPVFRKK